MEIIRTEKQEIEELFAHRLSQKIIGYLNQKVKVNLYLSGGSIVSSYDKIFSSIINQSNPNLLENISLYQVDERYSLDPLHKDSNQKSILNDTKMLSELVSLGANLKFILSGKSIEIETKNFEKTIQSNLSSLNSINIVLAGVGEDCHILGVKPNNSIVDINGKDFSSVFLNDEKFAHYYSADDYPNRITMTLSALKKMNDVFVFIKGEKKRHSVEIIESRNSTDIESYPAQILNLVESAIIFVNLD